MTEEGNATSLNNVFLIMISSLDGCREKKVEPNFGLFLNTEIVNKKTCKMFIFANRTILKSSYFED